jgi:hypothetical protein
MVLLDEPGSGKSTTLYHLTWKRAAAYQGNSSSRISARFVNTLGDTGNTSFWVVMVASVQHV